MGFLLSAVAVLELLKAEILDVGALGPKPVLVEVDAWLAI